MDFNEEKHEYKENGVVYPSVTQILQNIGISEDFSAVKEDVLVKAQMRGTAIHAQVESVLNMNDYEAVGEEALSIINFVREKAQELGGEIVCEQMVISKNKIYPYAGRYDLGIIKGKDIYLYDIKTSKTFTRKAEESASYQLSLYGYAIDYKVKGISVLRFDEDGFLKEVKLTLKTTEEIEEILTIAKEGGLYEPTKIIPYSELSKRAIEFFVKYNKKQKELKELETTLDEVKKLIKDYMDENGIYKVISEDGRVRITRTRDSEMKSLDSVKLKKEQPEMYSKYIKMLKRQGHLLITVKED